MGKLHIVQRLCPARHCIGAVAYLPGDPSPDGFATKEEAIAGLLEAQKAFGIRDRCGICGSTQLFFEDAPTKFDTMEEAMPEFTKQQVANLETRAALDELGLTYDVQQHRKRN